MWTNWMRMIDSSENQTDPFAKVKLAHANTLIRVLVGALLREEQHIRRRYSEIASDYEQTLNFLIDIEVVRREGSLLALLIPEPADDHLPELLIGQLLRTSGTHSAAIL